MRGELKPGDVLHESDLQKLFGISRPPIREALAQLTQEGLIRTIPKKGSVITGIDWDQLRQFFFVRSTLEEKNIEELVQKIDAQGIEVLKINLQKQKNCLEQKDFFALYDSMDEFHYLLFALNNMPKVWELIRRDKTTLDRAHALDRSQTEFERHMTLMYEQHNHLVKSLEAKDVVACVHMIKNHAHVDFETADSRSSNIKVLKPRASKRGKR